MADTISLFSLGSSRPTDNSLSSWLLDKDERVCAGCTLINISEGGAAVLIPVNQPATSEIFDLVIMSPEEGEGILTILQAEVRWIDLDCSETYIKMGMEFITVNPLKRQLINTLIDVVESNADVSCDIVNYRPAAA